MLKLPFFIPKGKINGSIWANNALVYYKPNSLPSCGVNTVTNSRAKARRT